jgi:hypothetical protein
MGPSGSAPAAQVHFLRGLPSLLRQHSAYQTAWLIRIQAARARAERRHGQRQEQQRDTFNSVRLGMQRWLGTTNNRENLNEKKKRKGKNGSDQAITFFMCEIESGSRLVDGQLEWRRAVPCLASDGNASATSECPKSIVSVIPY